MSDFRENELSFSFSLVEGKFGNPIDTIRVVL